MDFDDALAPRGNTFSYKVEMKEGDVWQGVLQGKPEISPDVDFNDKKQKETKNGKPMWQMKISLDVNGEVKTAWLKDKAYWAAVNAFRDAKSAHGDDMEFRGGIFGLKREADGEPTNRGFAPPKNYVAKFVPPEA